MKTNPTSHLVQMPMVWCLMSPLNVVNEAEAEAKAIHESDVGDGRNPRRRGREETTTVREGRGARAERDVLVENGDCN